MIDEICFSTALLEGAKEVFETMIFMEIEEPEPSGPDQRIEGDSLLGSITFRNSIEGCLSLHCSVPCAKTIAANMLGIDTPDEISEEDVCDALGEVTNMVMGSVKSRLQTDGSKLQVSIPTVIQGQNLASTLGNRANKVLVKVNTEEEDIIEFMFLYRESAE
jgi:chemotaxis protein CheX